MILTGFKTTQHSSREGGGGVLNSCPQSATLRCYGENYINPLHPNISMHIFHFIWYGREKSFDNRELLKLLLNLSSLSSCLKEMTKGLRVKGTSSHSVA